MTSAGMPTMGEEAAATGNGGGAAIGDGSGGSITGIGSAKISHINVIL